MSNELDVSKVKEGMYLEFIGKSYDFFGKYAVVTAESTYETDAECPIEEKGKLKIVDFAYDDEITYHKIEELNPTEWKLVE